jgi:hypothetical protein
MSSRCDRPTGPFECTDYVDRRVPGAPAEASATGRRFSFVTTLLQGRMKTPIQQKARVGSRSKLLLTFAFCSLHCSTVEETGNRRCRLHCHLGSHEPAAACSSRDDPLKRIAMATL